MATLKFQNLQFVYFLDRYHVPDRSAFMTRLKTSLGGGTEMILPIPDSAPEDVPLMLLQERDRYEIRIAKGRLDFHFLNDNPARTTNEIVQNFRPLNQRVYEILLDRTSFEIRDVGFIIRSLSNDAVVPNAHIRSLFGADPNLNFEETSDMLIRNLKKQDVLISGNTVKFNEIVTLQTSDNPAGGKIVSLEFDMNTFPKEHPVTVNNNFVEELITEVSNKNERRTTWLSEILNS